MTENEINIPMPELQAELTFLPAFNLALQQNAIPVVQELKLSNRTENDLQNLRCVFSSSPPQIREKTVYVDVLQKGETRQILDPGLELNYDLLSTISDSLNGTLKLEIFHNDTLLVSQEHNIKAYAIDQWLGLSLMPELLAAFVTPNLEVITLLESIVANELKQATGDPSIEGYQKDKTRVYETCAAIYRAIHSRGIQYANPAASVGEPGQRIRFADTISHYRLGTCLDTALLFASVMESCGLNPVILFQKEHAYVGCHLVDRYFPDVPMDDLQAIRKLVDLDEFLVIETTLVTGDFTFSEAEAKARVSHLNIDDDFECAIDIARARHSKIKPLPLNRSINGIELRPPDAETNELDEEQKRTLQEEIDLSQLENKTDNPRTERWRQKLLDLSLRNRLLNVRDTQQVIPVACADILALEDKIAANESITLNPLESLLSEKDLHDISMLRNSEISNDIKSLLQKELDQHRLWTMLPGSEMNKRLTKLYRQCKTDFEDGGVNTLFLGIGFLEWKVSERDDKSYLAPILMIPVKLQRRSITEGFRITRLDEDTVINETLLELLRKDFRLTVPGLSPLPTDDSGVDVSMVMQIFRQTIKEMKGWEVREEARLGHFSFGKFIMWNDLTTRVDDLQKNPLVNHLMSGSGIYDDEIEVFPPEEIANHLNLENLYCPMSADSSQLVAVLYSQTGKSFVLHGPPGTGKSQTITNIIAHNLALGRRVLFVSEKKAALDVVHKRLSAVGLRPFCLELHSNKAGKTEVLAQFSEALNVQNTLAPEEWQSTVQSLNELRKELNEYVTTLHYVYPNGLSAYDCFSRQLKYHDDLPDHLLEMDPLTQTKEELTLMQHTVADLAGAFAEFDRDALYALPELVKEDWSPVLEKGFSNAVRQHKTATEGLLNSFEKIAPFFSFPFPAKESAITQCGTLLEALKSCEHKIPQSFIAETFADDEIFLRQYKANMARQEELIRQFAEYELDFIPKINMEGIRGRIRQHRRMFFVIRFIKNRALLKELSGLKKIGSTPLTIAELNKMLPLFEEYVLLKEQNNNHKQRVKELLEEYGNDHTIDWQLIEKISAEAETIRSLIATICETSSAQTAMRQKIQEIMPDLPGLFAEGSEVGKCYGEFLRCLENSQKTAPDFMQYVREPKEDRTPDVVIDRLDRMLANMEFLRNVMRYRKIRKVADTRHLFVFANALEQGILQGDIREIFMTVYCRDMLDQIILTSPVLSNFSGSNQEARIKKFCELDQKYTSLTQHIIFAKLAANLPRRRQGPCPEGTELGILKRECEKRARQKAVRLLLEQIPTIAPVLKPCFLMSPLSVAQYLPADSASFDLIVFDEASQIPVWDAIGVIARGTQLIVVGDPKQMPPTNFFQKGDTGKDDDVPDETEDLESILDECIAAGVYSSYLNWHYRSRHESLISFSNHYYYDDRLFTFPAARNSERLGIRFEFVEDGVYDRRSTRTNRNEAMALVKYVFARLSESGNRKRSIGIVTFSQAQKDLIEDLLEQERRKYPELEEYFSEQNEEPLFVKNLENVQGDERDVILFSICYAPDAAGKFSMNFGPLNRQGGERRLNVAITRAKEQVVVFSSVNSTQIDTNRTQATGAVHLKYFLDYAEKGFRIRNNTQKSATLSEGLTDTVEEFLQKNGYQTERNVGSSGYTIDLAVRHPGNPDKFLLGIECDGRSYAAQWTPRDRDSLRNSVLQNLGWNVYRLWSVDWAFDRKRSEAKLLSLLEKLKTKQEDTPMGKPLPTTPEPVVATPVNTPTHPENRKKYRLWTCEEVLLPEDFYTPMGEMQIRKQLKAIIQHEAPITESLLRKRLVNVWGFARSSSKIQEVLDRCMPDDVRKTNVGKEAVYWNSGQDPAEYKEYRVTDDDEIRRKVYEIPPEELANAMYEVLTDFSSCETDVLYRETIKLFGFSAVTTKAREYLEYGLLILKNSGRA